MTASAIAGGFDMMKKRVKEEQEESSQRVRQELEISLENRDVQGEVI